MTELLRTRREIGATRARCSLESGLPPACARVAVRLLARRRKWGHWSPLRRVGPVGLLCRLKLYSEAGPLEPSLPQSLSRLSAGSPSPPERG